MEKQCTKCKIVKSLDDFHQRKNGRIAAECKCCHRAYYKEHSKIHSQENTERSKIWQNANKEKRKAIKQRWIEKNPDYHKQYRDQYYKDHPNYNRDLYWKDPIQRREASKQFRKINPKHNQYYQKARCKTDVNFRILRNLRQRMRFAMKNNKTEKTIKLIGCSIIDLKAYLELKFLPTMSWDNYGKYWQIDHIIPCSKFDLTILEEQLKCFHYTNLQPLFTITTLIDNVEYVGNINKGNRTI